jgi:hypothetical protein
MEHIMLAAAVDQQKQHQVVLAAQVVADQVPVLEGQQVQQIQAAVEGAD